MRCSEEAVAECECTLPEILHLVSDRLRRSTGASHQEEGKCVSRRRECAEAVGEWKWFSGVGFGRAQSSLINESMGSRDRGGEAARRTPLRGEANTILVPA